VKRHWKLWTGLTLLLVTLAVCGVLLATRDPEPVRAYDRIKLGMSLREVQDAIGMPAGDYRSTISSISLPAWDSRVKGLLSRPYSLRTWDWDSYKLLVAFGNDDHVIWVHLTEKDGPPNGPYGWLLRLLG